jgi:peptide/nickel transport system permease protein
MEYKKIIRRFFKSPLNTVSFVVAIAIIFIAIFPWLVRTYDPLTMDTMALLSPPSKSHIFGTDQFGRDIYSRIVYGIRNTMIIAALSILFATIIGTFLGVTSGYFGGIYDHIVMRFIDSMFAFPSLILALFIIAIFGASMKNLIIAIGVVYIPIFARTLRASTISTRQSLFITAAKTLGKSNFNIILKDIIPNLSSILIVTFTTNFSTAVLSEAALGFLGLGVPPPNPTLGGMVGQGNNFLLSAPWIALFPGMVIAIIVLCINIMGDGLRDILDPRTGK